MSRQHVLVLNCGSSSVKAALFAANGHRQRIWSGRVERIGMPQSKFFAETEHGKMIDETRGEIAGHGDALDLLLSRVDAAVAGDTITAVGHRIVHGGEDCDCPVPIGPGLEAKLRKLIPLAPLHLPHNLAGVAAVRSRRPHLPQIACFDTAFHQTLPRIARLTGLPRELEDRGVRRYGFHGLSYEYILADLRERDGVDAVAGRLIVAHLGNGASMAAIKDGRSIETTMGFSGLGGLLMGTRPGDMDPGILLFLGAEMGLSREDIGQLLYNRSGLLGVSGISRNMRDLLAQPDSPQANEAVELFCYQAARQLAALTVPLGGLDRVVFTGGIGANAPEIRERICAKLSYLGLEIDTDRNRRQERYVSSDVDVIVIQAIPTDEESMIAQHTIDLMICAKEAIDA